MSLATALPTLLVGTLTAGYLLVSQPTDAHPASSPLASRHGSGTRTAADGADLPLRVEDPAVTIVGPRVAPRVHHRRTVPAPSAARRDADLARWIAAGGTRAAGTGSTTPGTTGSPTAADPAVGTSDTTGPSGTSGTTGTTGAGTTPDSTSGSPTGSGSGGGVAADFVLSSFNVLGASHTRNGGRGRASGVTRINGVAALLNRHDVDVAGFQELQQGQARALLRVTGGSYALYPGPGRGKDSENSVGWRTSEFELVRGTTVSIPYFNGHHRNMPVVLLRNRASGVSAWFGSFHNPAETSQYHHQQHWRDLATAAEAALANRVLPTGVPLFITGDMNERAPYFCRLTAATSMVAARPGSVRTGSTCQAGRPRAVDWVFGTRGVSFSGYDEDRTHLVDITTDHPVVSTRVRVSSAVFPRSVS